MSHCHRVLTGHTQRKPSLTGVTSYVCAYLYIKVSACTSTKFETGEIIRSVRIISFDLSTDISYRKISIFFYRFVIVLSATFGKSSVRINFILYASYNLFSVLDFTIRTETKIKFDLFMYKYINIHSNDAMMTVVQSFGALPERI